ncbi:hypothetical protein MLDJOKPK_00061 [Salmonella phage SPAsTU]|nr:hypothetical protein STsAS_079 [Salmonella phage STsAS]AWN09008.1 hypothetical protein MLDJOKPK_00061 [Salmonella phage SPAsTU]
MFYRELQQLTTALTGSNVTKNGDLEDVAAALRAVPGVSDVTLDSQYLGDGVKRIQLSVRAKHGCCSLNFRVSAEYFLVLRSFFSHDGDVYPARWASDFSKFGYPLSEHRKDVHAFIAAVVAGF